METKELLYVCLLFIATILFFLVETMNLWASCDYLVWQSVMNTPARCLVK